MTARRGRKLLTLAIAASLALCFWTPSHAGTTGQLRGTVTDATSHAPLANVRVSAIAPSQSEATTTNASGQFTFISLAPDTYTVTAAKDGYDTSAVPGETVVADQSVVVKIEMQSATKVLGHVVSETRPRDVRPGVTSDEYSINSAAQKAASAVGGPGGVDFAYSALATIPGVNILQGQQGWQQLISIRGGDPGDVAVELDGIPMNRSSDSGTASTLSSLGQQELQAYTGGTPASADANGLSGYLNQVIRNGTYPGFATASFGIGGPALYNKASFEAGGATPNRNFRYYVATSIVNQDYRYGDQFNNVAGIGSFFYPLSITSNNGVYDGSGPAVFSPGNSYALASTDDHESVMNFHFSLPHAHDSGADDVQLLYVTSEIFGTFYSSVNDLGGPTLLSNTVGYPTYTDIDYYGGQMFAPPDPSKLTIYRFPSSPTDRSLDAPLGVNQRDGNDNGIGVVKLQYQHNIGNASFLRVFGYTNYSNWFINGPVSTFLPLGGEISDFELTEHAWGIKSVYENQLNQQNLLTATAGYELQRNQTYSSSSFGIIKSNFIDSAGNCYSPSSGSYASCFSGDGLNEYSQFGIPISGTLTPPTSAPLGSPAILNNAQWIMTENGVKTEQQDNVIPIFTSVSLTDQFRPSDRWLFSVGLRGEQFQYKLGDTADPELWPARQFWFEAFDRENCYASGQPGPTSATVDPSTGVWTCPADTTPVNLQNTHPAVAQYGALEPRLGGTLTLSPYTVVRATYGRYVEAPSSSDQEINATQQDLASRLSEYLSAGYTTPYHDTRPGYANNFDLSLERSIRGTQASYEISPYYRTTRNQVESVPIGSQGDVVGLNTGEQQTSGVELLLRDGDFSREGISWQLSYAYTRDRVRYGNFGTAGQNFVDTLNAYVQHYNSFTSACASGNAQLCGPYGSSNAVAVEPGTNVVNPYFNDRPQALFDRNGWYSPYTILPSPLQGAVGYETPDELTALVNYRRAKFSITPSVTYTSGSYYGSPLVWPGYDPSTCAALGSPGPPDTTTCSQGSPSLFIPDPYTGKFDSQGAFREPARFTLNAQLGYKINARVDATLALTSLIDRCIQRGFAWDSASTCVYGQLPSNELAPVGNFVPLALAPVQLRFPYSSWLNNEWVGYVGQKLPFTAFATVEFKL